VSLVSFAKSPKEAEELSRAILRLFETSQGSLDVPDALSFRVDNEELIPVLNKLEHTPFLKREGDNYRLRMVALKELNDPRAQGILNDCGRILELLLAHYKKKETRKLPKKLTELAKDLGLPLDRIRLCVELLTEESWAWAYTWNGPPVPLEERYVIPGENILEHKSIDSILSELDRQTSLIARDRFGGQLLTEFGNPTANLFPGSRRFNTFRTAFESYEIEEQIGQGGSAVVYKVLSADSGIFAIKMLKPGVVTTERMKRFRNEAAFCQRVGHPNVLRVIEWGLAESEEGNSFPFFVSPYYPKTLRNLIRDGISKDNVLPLYTRVLDGIEAAHLLNIVHRDIKPENIFYDPKGNSLVVGDFGIAHFSEEEIVTAVETQAAERLANFQYAAPEQRVRGSQVGIPADIYALGLILNEMFTKEVVQGTAYRKIADVAPEFGYLDPLVDAMIRQRPQERLAEIASIKRELIGRGNQFVSQQRLDALKKSVVPTSRITDPLLEDPVRLTSFDYNKNTLILILSQPVNPKWIHCFHSIGNYEFFMGGGPFSFSFNGNQATIVCETRYVQQVIDWFKGFLGKATADYERVLQAEKQMLEEKERKELQRRVAEEEARSQLLKNIRL